ncbi:lytic murein transglycosylase B, partial [Macromonas nakdongensis]|uniref:lytic murein transglycosylase B n=1 Tax=Macromonas nakdongensis TaxID=1843082 RepID=UPI000C33113F
GYAQHDAARAFAAELDRSQGWDDGWASRWIAQAERRPQVIKLMQPAPAGQAKNWTAYRQRFVEPKRLQAGARFWAQHAQALQRAEAHYGVPAWLIVGIIGVETLYGQHTGTFRVLDALTTLAFDFPADHPRAAQRSEFFRSELAAFLQLARDSGVSPLDWRGSYAGAMGLPQFMPSNWSRFGVDFDRDGQVDLLGSPADAIASVARYLQAYGWQSGMPTHYPVTFDPGTLDLDTLLAPDILPTFSAATLQAKGVRLGGAGTQHNGPLALVELENGDPAQGGGPRSYVAGTDNFYAITRYNWSSYYALAVIELGQAVQARVQR